VLDSESVVDVLNEEPICLVVILLPGTAHRIWDDILSGINPLETRSVSLEDATRCIYEPIPSLLIECIKVLIVKSEDNPPERRMNDIVIIQKIDKTAGPYVR
jgi:hypothetical protein